MYSVYVISDPESKSPVYIGITSQPSLKRFSQHLNNSHNEKLKSYIESLNGVEPLFNILESDISYEEALKSEQAFIEIYTEWGIDLFNLKAGRPKGSGVQEKTIQKNVRVKQSKLDQLSSTGKLTDLTFSAYVNVLISQDLAS